MARSVNDAIEIEEPDHLPDLLELGPRPLTAFEAARLAEDPCRPIWRDQSIESAAQVAEQNWLSNLKQRSRAVPATYLRTFVRSEGSK